MCYSYAVPDPTVTREEQAEEVVFPSTGCEVEEREEQHCANLPTELVCKDRTVRNIAILSQVDADTMFLSRSGGVC